MAGTPAQARTRDYVVSQMKSWGLETEVRSYSVWMPHPVTTRVWRIAPDPIELNLQEGPLPEDTTSVAFSQVLPFNGYGAAGNVRGEVVYVNYGLIEDYAQLDSMGVSVKGKIAIARYGRSYRGIKAREAEKHGALGLIIYSDPADDGYVRGDVYPLGPMRPSQGVQRGSVMNPNGDPSTPGYQTQVPMLTWDWVPGASSYEVDLTPYNGSFCDWGALTDVHYRNDTAVNAWTRAVGTPSPHHASHPQPAHEDGQHRGRRRRRRAEHQA